MVGDARTAAPTLVLVVFVLVALGVAHAELPSLWELRQLALSGADLDSMESKDLELLGLRQYMLGLINEERAIAGLEPVILGTNEAAQSHAESMLEYCFMGHWGLDGLKPYMRYTLTNGTQYNAENVSGYQYCIEANDGYRTVQPRDELAGAMYGLMDSLGHRDNILDPHHARVNIGVAYNEYQLWVVQHFEYDYVVFHQPPTIQGAILSFSGYVVNGSNISSDDDLGVAISYDPPPHNLTRGQVERTYCYDSGLPVATILPPPAPGYYYVESSYTTTLSRCPDPYDVPPDAPAQMGPPVGWTYPATTIVPPAVSVITVPFIEAVEWTADQDRFELRADIASVLLKHGPGVYTVTLWGKVDGQDAVVGEGVIFHHVDVGVEQSDQSRVVP